MNITTDIPWYESLTNSITSQIDWINEIICLHFVEASKSWFMKFFQDFKEGADDSEKLLFY